MSATTNKTEEMKKIRDAVMALEESPLYRYRVENNYYPVIGEGDHDANIVFVGEAPGKNEALQARPFCGAAGRILDELLTSIDLPRERVYITNIVKDRPPENRDPTPDEIELYAPFLDQQLAVIQPKVVATLGRFSMQYVMRRYNLGFEIEPISVAHGKVYETTTEFGDIKVAPQYHPAAAIYNQSLKDTLRQDFRMLKQFI